MAVLHHMVVAHSQVKTQRRLTGLLHMQVVTLPRTSVEFLPYGNSVFIVKEEGDTLTVHRRQVTTGRTLGTRVEIIKGIESGEQVVSTGQLKLRNGQHIQIDNSVELTGGATQG